MQNLRPSNIKVIFQRPCCGSPYSGGFRFHCQYCPCGRARRNEGGTSVGLRQAGHTPGKPGIFRDFFDHGKLGEFSWNSVKPPGKNCITREILERQGHNIWDFSYQGLGFSKGNKSLVNF